MTTTVKAAFYTGAGILVLGLIIGFAYRTAEVRDLEVAVDRFAIMLDKSCKYKNQGNGNWTYYDYATSTPPLVCDAPEILATSTATSTN